MRSARAWRPAWRRCFTHRPNFDGFAACRMRKGLRLGSMALPTGLDAMLTAPHGTTTLEVVPGSAKASEATCASHPPLSSRYSKPCVRRGYKEFPAPVLKMEDGLCAGQWSVKRTCFSSHAKYVSSL